MKGEREFEEGGIVLYYFFCTICFYSCLYFEFKRKCLQKYEKNKNFEKNASN